MAGEFQPDQIATNTGGVGSIPALVDVDPPNQTPGLPALDARLLFNLPPNSIDYLEARDAAGGQQFTGGFADFEFGTVDLNSGAFGVSGAEITVNLDGVIEVLFSISLDELSGNNRSDWTTQLLVNGSFQPGWGGFVYSRNNAQGRGTLTKSRLYLVSSGDVIRVQVSPGTGPNDYESIANASNVTIKSLKGAKGDQGPPGTGEVDVLDDGTLLGAGPFGAFNFIGPGVTVAPSATPGRVDVTVPGGSSFVDSYYTERLDSQSTTANKASGGASYINLNSDPLEGGVYKCEIHFLVEPPSTSQDWCVRFRVGGQVVSNPGGDDWLQEEGKDTGGDQRNPRGCFRRLTLPAGAALIEVDFARSATSGTIVMHTAIVELTRVA